MNVIQNKIKYCRVCNNELLLDVNWLMSFKRQGQYICQSCEAIRSQKYKKPKISRIKQTKEEIDVKRRINRFMNKKILFEMYGNQCAHCSQQNWMYLSLDHINNDGAIDRKNDRKTGQRLYRSLIKLEKQPENKYQLLCHNCNGMKGHHGFLFPNLIPEKSESCVMCRTTLQNNQFDFNKANNDFLCCDCVVENSISLKNDANFGKKYRGKRNSLDTKLKIITNYGECCEICKEDNFYYLTIDHIFGGGEQERKSGTYISIYRELIKQNYPKDKYRLLCYNCNCSHGAFGHFYSNLLTKFNMPQITLPDYIELMRNKMV